MRRSISLTSLLFCTCLVYCAFGDRNRQSSPTSLHSATENETVQADKQPIGSRSEIDTLIARHTKAFVSRQPLFATTMAINEADAGGPYLDRLPNYSPRSMTALQSEMANGVQELKAIPTTNISENDKLHLKIVSHIEAYFAGLSSFSSGYIDTWGGHLPYLVNQIGGPLITAPQVMQTQQRVRTREEAEAYVKRLVAFSPFVERILSKIQADEAAGVILPKKLFPKTLTFLDRFVESPADKHALVTSFEQRLDSISELSPKQRSQFVRSACRAIREHVYPSYRRLRSFIAAQEERAPESDGIWSQPRGTQYYQHALRFLADTKHSADEVHEIGLREVARITAEMNQILLRNGKKSGSVGQRMAKLSKNPQFLYSDSTEGRQALLESQNLEIQSILHRAPKFFSTLPKASVEIRRVPTEVEAGAPGGYYNPPSLDGIRPGIYWINLRDMEAVPRFSLKTLTYHEAVPGHHFQIALNMEQKSIGLFRKKAPFNAFAEGWALYSELLANEMGMYEDDSWGDLGRLQAELYRSVRLVVDTGLHHKRWTREKAIRYFSQTTGIAESDVVVEIERYMVWPGQALGYKLGMLEILRLRELAKDTLGSAFDLRAFHDVVLLPGARPMSILAHDVEQWIERQKQLASRSEARSTYH